jgi:ABC-2 type transport system permease protein
MGKIGLIIRREYLTRVRKKSFIIMTILGPLLMAAIAIVPVWIASASKETRVIQVIDEMGIANYQLKENENIRFAYTQQPIEDARANLEQNKYYAILHLPRITDENFLLNQRNFKIYSGSQISLTVKIYLENQLERQIEKIMLKSEGVDPEIVESVKKSVRVNLSNITEEDEKKGRSADVEVSTALGFAGGIMIYFFIFLYGAQVMRGVIEEKTSRIVEVIISSVKPFQLMMGKIIGIALVGLTQFLLWVVLTFAIYSTVMSVVVKDRFSKDNIEQIIQSAPEGTTIENVDEMIETGQIIDRIKGINWALMIPAFIFYFLGGYLLYGALFAAIGGAVDNEADTQQFMLPITIPLILAIVVAQTVMQDPTGKLAFWFSIIPFTSPVVMMVRLPFQVHILELLLSMGLLVVGFIFTTWLAGRIYRTGILMYGKKVNYKELWKWLRY